MILLKQCSYTVTAEKTFDRRMSLLTLTDWFRYGTAPTSASKATRPQTQSTQAAAAAASSPPRILLMDGGVSTHLESLIAPSKFSYRHLWSSSLLLNDKHPMVARSDLTRLEDVIPNSKSYRCDAGDPDAVTACVSSIRQDMGPKVDALMYNAGSGVFKPFAEASYNDFMLSMKVGPGGISVRRSSKDIWIGYMLV
mmetsp:Transcript_31647/g.76797  ORF Transcript_31647/g.76797 Transcript_31647/m.76797 type:complete len:196 (-) Transcript_31647:1203-1790(-)